MRLQWTKNKNRRIWAFLWAAMVAAVSLTAWGGLPAGHPMTTDAMRIFCPAFFLVVLLALLIEAGEVPRALARAGRVLGALFSVFVLLCATEMLSGIDLIGLIGRNIRAGGLGLGIVLVLVALFFACTGSLGGAIRWTTVLCALFGYVSHFVWQLRGSTFIAQDIFGASTALEVMPSYTLSVTGAELGPLVLFVGVWLLAGRLRLPRRPGGAARWIARGAALALSAVCLFVLITSEDLYESLGLSPDRWDQSLSSAQNGSVVNFFSGIPDTFVKAPTGYSHETVDGIARMYPSQGVSHADRRPDVILIMGESWADLTGNGAVETNIPVTPFLDSLKDDERALYRKLIVSGLKGGTSLSEFQVFTGTNAMHGIHLAPFQFLVNEPIANVVHSFKQLGYDTTAMHTGNLTAWNRDNAFPVLGFDTFLGRADIEQPDSKMLRNYLSDEAMYQRALSILDRADEPQFLYLCTIQTHGDYDTDTYESPIKITSPAGDHPLIEQYLGLMHESDRDLAAFIRALSGRERPTVVLGYGDHAPKVDDTFWREVIAPQNEAFGGVNVADYETFFFVWANEPLPGAVLDAPPYISLQYLNVYLTESAGLPMTGYQQFLKAGHDRFPVAARIGAMDAHGQYIPYDQAVDSTLYAEQAIMQYNLLYDRDHAPDDFFALAEP